MHIPTTMPKQDMKIRAGVEAAGLSDIGCQRENNEDSFAYWESENDAVFDVKGRLAVVADGMGGYEGGQEASHLAVETVLEVYGNSTDASPDGLLVEALRTAHERIRERATANPSLYGMGTTCTAAAIVAGRLYFAHVGDSRLYLLRSGNVQQLTRDHSYVGRLVESGLISRSEAEIHPQRHILTAALGTVGELVADSSETPLVLDKGDILLLCTDGLWGQVKDEELSRIPAGQSMSEVCRDLIRLARQRGGPDNITLQVLRIA